MTFYVFTLEHLSVRLDMLLNDLLTLKKFWRIAVFVFLCLFKLLNLHKTVVGNLKAETTLKFCRGYRIDYGETIN